VSETAKTILVIGATGSIGVPVCHFLAKSGYSLVLAARDTENLQMLCRELKSAGAASHAWVCVDTADDQSIDAFAEEVAARNISVDGVVLIPPRPPRLHEAVPASNAWHEFFQKSFIGPSALLKTAIATMKPDPANGRRSKVVIILGIFAASLPDELATSNLLHGAWAGEAKRLAFALGERGIHVNSLSLDKEVARWRGGSFKRAADVETMFEQRQADGASNAPSGEWRRPDEVGIAVEILLSPFSDDMTGLDIQHDSVSSFKYSRRKPTIATGRPQARG